MGANAGKPHDIEMQTAIVTESLQFLHDCETPGKIQPLAHEYVAKV